MKVAVIGSGVMGPGVAQTWLMAGHEVSLADSRREALEAGVARIRESLALMREKGIFDDAGAAGAAGAGSLAGPGPDEDLLSRLRPTTSLAEAAGGADLVIEAVTERPDVKAAVYRELDKACRPDAVVVSNTSALPVPVLFPDFRPGRFFVAHYLNPPEIVPLVEVVADERTDPQCVEWLCRELRRCGKRPIVVRGFVAGFLVNRLQSAMMREALTLVERGVVTPEDIDTAVTAGIGFKSAWQGLFETLDYIGLDTVALGCGFIFPDLSSRTDVPETITSNVAEGNLGVKTGRGFFDYSDPSGARKLEERSRFLLSQLGLWRSARR